MKSLELIPTQEVLLDTFTRDSVGRSDLVLRLAEMINEIDGHYAIAIDSKWGNGKTFFVKQVKLVLDSFNSFGVQTLSEEEKSAITGYIQSDKRRRAKPIEFEPQVCVYYDAWENDNDDDPVMSLIYCILGSVQEAYLISVVCVFPVAIALRITDMEAYNNFISGKDGTPLIEMIDREKCSGLCRLLLAPGETYDDPRDSREVKVSVADKISAVYSALFEKQFGRSEYEIAIGEACFSTETRESFFKLLSLLSEDANYSY